MKRLSVLLCLAVISEAWIPLNHPTPRHRSFSLSASTSPSSVDTVLFDFTRNETLDQFDRIDDVIMGGVSTSSLVPGPGYARWVGVCRTDGGGFCGIRTLPFHESINVSSADGLYVLARLASDKDVDRRVWKITTRTRPDRGEQLYQAQYQLQLVDEDKWARVEVPLDTFRLVRGPRLVPGGAPLDNQASGLFQIGMTMSKFPIAENTTELENFRDGFFELQLREIGVYQESKKEGESTGEADTSTISVSTLSKKEALKQRPFLLKVLLLLSKVFFTEQSRRRRSTMNLLKERGFSRRSAVLFGLKSRTKSLGVVRSVSKLVQILAVDSFRTIVGVALRVLTLPLRLLGVVVRRLQKMAGQQPKVSLKE